MWKFAFSCHKISNPDDFHLISNRVLWFHRLPAVKPKSPQVLNVTFQPQSNQAVIHMSPYQRDYLHKDNQLFQFHIWSLGSPMVETWLDIFSFKCFSNGWIPHLVKSLFSCNRFKTWQGQRLCPSTWSTSKRTQNITSKCEQYQMANLRACGVSGVMLSLFLPTLVRALCTHVHLLCCRQKRMSNVIILYLFSLFFL